MLRPVIFTYAIRTPVEIRDEVIAYAGIIAFDMMASYVVLAYSTILQSVGDAGRPAIVSGLMSLTNVILDPFLILGIGPFPRLVVVEAAIATVTSRVLGVVTLFIMIERSYPDLRVRLTKDIGG